MKETKIAKDNLKNMNGINYNDDCYSHRDTCQRWLEFLEKVLSSIYYGDVKIEKKIKDLKQVKEIYKEAGI